MDLVDAANEVPRPRRRHLPIVILLVVAAFFYLAFPAHILECDAVMFAYGALHRDLIFMGYAHHLGYNLLQFIAAGLGRQFDPPVSPIYILQYLSMAAGLAGAYVFHRMLIRIRVRLGAAVLLSGTLLFCYAYWHYSRQADTHIITAFLLICFLSRMERLLKAPSLNAAAVSGLILGIATIMHQSSILLLPAVLVAFAACRAIRHHIVRYMSVFALVYGIAGILPYPVTGWHMVGIRTFGDFHGWLTDTSQWGGWGIWRKETIAATVIGIVRSLTGSHYLLGSAPIASMARRLFPAGSFQDEMAIAHTVPVWLRPALIIVQAGVILMALRAVLRSILRLRRTVASAGRALVFLLMTWIVTLGIFFAWWAPERVEFWISWFVPSFALVGLAYREGEAPGFVPRWAVAVFLGGLFCVNFFGSIYPQSGPLIEVDTSVGVAIDSVVDKGDIVLSDCSFSGRASQYSQSFRKINLLDPLGDTLPSGLPKTLYWQRRGRTPQTYTCPDTSYASMVPELRSRALAVVDSIMGEADKQNRNVYLVMTPLQSDPGFNFVYRQIVEAIENEYDLSEQMSLRADINIRRIRRP